MANNSVPKFIFRLSRFPVYRGSVLGKFNCIKTNVRDSQDSTHGVKCVTKRLPSYGT